MRLKDHEKNILRETVRSRDPNARVYLFGSRTDDARKGGDIDILVLSDCLTFDDKLKIKTRLFDAMDEQTIHMIIARSADEDPFVKIALSHGMLL